MPPPSPPFTCPTDSDGHVAWVRPTGDLDVASAPVLRGCLARAARGDAAVALDPAGLRFSDAAGVHVLLEVAELARVEGWDFVVLRGAPFERLFGLLEWEDWPNFDGPARIRASG